MKGFWRVLVLTTIGPLAATAVLAEPGDNASNPRQYTYAWLFGDDDTMQPRGGTSTGSNVLLDTQPSSAWQALQEPGLSKFERDRRAILAMAGPYRTSFDFIETAGFVAGHRPDRPYQSWGTEYVYVLADEPSFISLQHILVMFFMSDDGSISEPVVVKHWRQDWTYEDRDLHEYVGHNTWQHKTLSRKDARGRWTQAVFQVDDSPRYESAGRWQHHGNYSSWQSADTWRPLPRREFSVRDDYHVLAGSNRHTITPTGWVHEQDNLKLVLDDTGQPAAESPYLARETGLNRYERIVDHDFSAGDEYWKRTAPFWADVREAWHDLFESRDRFTVKSTANDQRLFEAMFEHADELKENEAYDTGAARSTIDDVLEKFVFPGDSG